MFRTSRFSGLTSLTRPKIERTPDVEYSARLQHIDRMPQVSARTDYRGKTKVPQAQSSRGTPLLFGQPSIESHSPAPYDLICISAMTRHKATSSIKSRAHHAATYVAGYRGEQGG